MFGWKRRKKADSELPEDLQRVADFIDGEHRVEGSTELTFDLRFDESKDEGPWLVKAASGPEVGGSWGIERTRSVTRMRQAMVEWHRLFGLERDLLPPPWVCGESILEMRRLYRRLWPNGPSRFTDDASVSVELIRDPDEGWYVSLKESGDGRVYAVLPPGLPVRGQSGEADTRRVLVQWEAWVIDYHLDDPDAPPWEEFPGESAEEILVNFPDSVAEAFRERIARDEQGELYSCSAGEVFRAEVQVADEDGGVWFIWDLDGRLLGSIEDHGVEGWKHSSSPIDTSHGSFSSFEKALTDRLTAIQSSGGVHTDDLYWEGEGLPRLQRAA